MDWIAQNWDIILVSLLIGIELGAKIQTFRLKEKVESKGYDFSKLLR